MEAHSKCRNCHVLAPVLRFHNADWGLICAKSLQRANCRLRPSGAINEPSWTNQVPRLAAECPYNGYIGNLGYCVGPLALELYGFAYLGLRPRLIYGGPLALDCCETQSPPRDALIAHFASRPVPMSREIGMPRFFVAANEVRGLSGEVG